MTMVVVGCAATAEPGARGNGLVPATAQLAASGKAGIAHFTPGGVTIYVVDETDKALIFSGGIPEDAQAVIRVDPDMEAVVVQGPSAHESDKPDEGKPFVLAKPIDKTHRFSIWTSAPTTRPAQDM